MPPPYGRLLAQLHTQGGTLRIRTAAAAALLAATLTACLPGSDDKAAQTPSSAPADDPRDDCLADLVKAYPGLDPETPMLDQVDTCAGLRDPATSRDRLTQRIDDDLTQVAVADLQLNDHRLGAGR
ncbi:hypothetical protein [Streptomyces sp. KR55]|uniref:hypothetical protein n=1 Tax=Streptomyces sp. KR55 TaxID=3457425 RepID=UPI003FD60FBF